MPDQGSLISALRAAFSAVPVATRKYPGVTRVLGETADKTFLEAWRARVGEEEAERITNESIMFGNSLDNLVRLHYQGGIVIEDHASEPGYDLYKSIRPWLNRVTPISLQCELFSDRMGVRGFPDLIGVLDDTTPIVIDIKNTRSTKRRDWITDYFLQCTMYAMMIKDTFGIAVPNIAIFMADRSRVAVPQIFIERTHEFVRPALERIASYRKCNHCRDNYPYLLG